MSNKMLSSVWIGGVAGAVGTVALDVTTYVDMAIRGRSSSGAPAQMVSILAKAVGLPLSSQGVGSEDETAQNRKNGLGALLGYVNGLGVGVAYGLLRSGRDDVPIPLAGIGMGLAAMAASDIPLVALRVSNPKTWGFSGWAADAIPHLVYGIVTAAVYEALTNLD